jgi:triosephosphate isomerase
MRAIIVANWKMYPESAAAAKKLLEATKKAIEPYKALSTIVAPPAVFVRELSKGRGRIAFASQSARAEQNGAFTGDVSLTQVKDARCTYALVGHAERRARGETNEDTSAQLQTALALGLSPILCIGERERSADGRHFAFVKEQLRAAFAAVKAPSIKKLMIAYEPVWAIGAAKPMTPRDMHEMSIFVRKTMVELLGPAAMEVRILYGGAIDATTARPMLEDGDVHGLLVGRASVDAAAFKGLITAIGS